MESKRFEIFKTLLYDDFKHLNEILLKNNTQIKREKKIFFKKKA